MLATQMFLVNDAMLNSYSVFNNAISVDVHDKYVNSMTKLARTYATQMETLKKYRSKGQQKITVEHLNVNQGGRAVVGDVSVESKGEGNKSAGYE